MWDDVAVFSADDQVWSSVVGEYDNMLSLLDWVWRRDSEEIKQHLSACILDIMLDHSVGLTAKRNIQRRLLELSTQPTDSLGVNLDADSQLFHASNASLVAVPTLYVYMWNASNITQLILCHNELREIPEELSLLRLQSLDVCDNRLRCLTPALCLIVTLKTLKCSRNFLSCLPDNIGLLKLLVELRAAENAITFLPRSLFALPCLEILDISGPDLPRDFLLPASESNLDLHRFLGFFSDIPSWTDCVSRSDQERMFREHATGEVLSKAKLEKVEVEMMEMYWRWKGRREASFAFDPALLTMKSLRRLSMRNVGIQGKLARPPAETLTSLDEVDLSNNQIADVHLLLHCFSNIRNIALEGNPLQIPDEVKNRGQSSILNYLRGMAEGAHESFKMMLFLHGPGGVGKTSLLAALREEDFNADCVTTDGIDISRLQVKVDDKMLRYIKLHMTPDEQRTVTQRLGRRSIENLLGIEIEFVVYDFAGQEVYYNSHQLFLHNRALDLVLWDVRRGPNNSGLTFWLNNIKTCAPRAPVILVGTKTDEIDNVPLDSDDFTERFPQIKGFQSVSSKSGRGIQELRNQIVKQALLEGHVGQRIPHKWSVLEDTIVREARRSQQGYVRFQTLREWARLSAFRSEEAIEDAADFLHDVGTIVRFSDADAKLSGLDDIVITDKQWLADVMRCIITAKAQEHVLSEADLARLWEKYPPEVHRNLIDLLKRFDLLVESEEHRFLVPCLLPTSAPAAQEVEQFLRISSTRPSLSYRSFALSFCPHGFFSRLQARLRDYDAGKFSWCRVKMWRRGLAIASSFECRGVVRLGQESSLVECVFSGEGKENLISIVSESVHLLLSERYDVDYDVLVPCEGCLEVCPREPHMFSSNRTLNRAMQRNQIFLQCQKEFHNVPVAHYLTAMPVSLRVSQAQLDALLDSLALWKATQTAYVYLSMAPDEEDAVRAVRDRIASLLEAQGVQVWIPQHHSPAALASNELALSCATVVLALISSRYCDPQGLGVKEIQYAIEVKPKPIIPVVVQDESRTFPLAWMKTLVGLHLSGQLYIDLRADNGEAISQLLTRTQALLSASGLSSSGGEQHFDFMISYSWSNCDKPGEEDNVRRSFSDPRRIKQALEGNTRPEYQLRGWLDVEQLGYRPREGLYEGIRRGLTQSDVVVVCMSDEYAISRNCCMECRYAVLHKKPILLVLVGSDENSNIPAAWKSTETGLLTSHIWSNADHKHDVQMIDFRNVPNFAQFEENVSKLQRMIESLRSREQAASESREDFPQPINLSDAVEEKMRFGRRMAIQFLRSHSPFGSSFPVLWVIQWQPKTGEGLSGYDAWEANDYYLRVVSEAPDGWVLVPHAKLRLSKAYQDIQSMSPLLLLVLRCLAVLQQGILCSLSKIELTHAGSNARKAFLRYEDLEVFLTTCSKARVTSPEAVRSSLLLIHSLVQDNNSSLLNSTGLTPDICANREVFWSLSCKAGAVKDPIDADWLVEQTKRSQAADKQFPKRKKQREVTLQENVKQVADRTARDVKVSDNISKLRETLSRQRQVLALSLRNV
eukprot:749914-Hanusia_phi.AAC.7